MHNKNIVGAKTKLCKNYVVQKRSFCNAMHSTVDQNFVLVVPYGITKFCYGTLCFDKKLVSDNKSS
ncbi:hypothetical protein EON70_00140 [bacterium]|nr:MAG: hypothetical protein EON70_00140 [bacterium]